MLKDEHHLDNARVKINEIDSKIVCLLVKRMNLALLLSDLKDNTVEAISAKDRVEIVLSRVERLALENHGDASFIHGVYEYIISELTNMQLAKKGLE